MLTEKENYYVYTGTRDSSGSGRNVRITKHVDPINNYNFLPVDIPYRKSNGTKIVPKSNLIKDLYNNFKDILTYEMYIEYDKLQDVYFTTKNGDKTLGGIVSAGNGNIIFLPNIDFERKEFYEDEDTWNENALQKGIAFKNRQKIDYAKQVANEITKDEFERDMTIVYSCLQKVNERAFD